MAAQTITRARPYVPSRRQARRDDFVLMEFHRITSNPTVGPQTTVEYDIQRVTAATKAGVIRATRDRWHSSRPIPFEQQSHLERWVLLPPEDLTDNFWADAMMHHKIGHPAQPTTWKLKNDVWRFVFDHLQGEGS